MALKGKQKKLDKNNNGRIDAEDFKILQGSKKGMRMGGMSGYGAARTSGMGLQDESMKPGKVMKAKRGRLADSDSSNYLAIQAPATISANYTLTMPANDGDADQALTTNGSGVLSWTTISGGADWQAVITADPANAVAGEGYFCNTTSAAFTVTLPTSASRGDFVSIIDYAGTFDTNNLTIGRNGHNIQGSAADLTVATERAAFTLVYVDATQGWLLQNN